MIETDICSIAHKPRRDKTENNYIVSEAKIFYLWHCTQQ